MIKINYKHCKNLRKKAIYFKYFHDHSRMCDILQTTRRDPNDLMMCLWSACMYKNDKIKYIKLAICEYNRKKINKGIINANLIKEFVKVSPFCNDITHIICNYIQPTVYS